MSIRLRLTLLYSTILALTLIIFGTALYTIQSEQTMNTLKSTLIQNGDGLTQSILGRYLNPNQNQNPPPKPPNPPVGIGTLSGEQAINKLRERKFSGHSVSRHGRYAGSAAQLRWIEGAAK